MLQVVSGSFLIGMMKIRAALLICAVLLQAVASEETCKAVLFDGKPHIEELIKADVYRPASLVVDYKTNTLYFSYLQLYYLEFRTVRLDLNTKQFNLIDVYGGSVITVDQKRHVPYIGAAKGLYEYDSLSNKVRLILPQANVWRLYFREALYYIDVISHFVYKYVDGNLTRFEDLARITVYFFARDDDYIVYSNGTGVYGKSVGSGESVLLKQVKNVDQIKEITLDRKGRFFVLSVDGIYKVDRFKQSLEKVADIQEANGLTFDAENQLIYSKESSVVRLVPNNNCEI